MFDTIHNHFHGLSDDDRRMVRDILKKLNNMPTKAEFQAAFDEVGGALTNIAQDITQLTDSLESGDLSATEEADVFAQLRGIADQAKALADRTKAPGETVESPEQPDSPEGEVTEG